MHSTIIRLLADGPIILDGAWGTQFQQRGLPIGASPDPWNLERPEMVLEVARSYVSAGSKVILTNTFGASSIALARHGMSDQATAVNRAGAELSVQAAGGACLVFGSVGPCGKMVAMGEIGEDEAAAAFAEQAEALAAGGVHGIVVETMTELEESALAVAAAARTGLPVVVSLVYGAGPKGDRTIMGVTPEQALEVLGEAGAGVIGTNCGVGPAAMLPIVARLKAAGGLPVWAKPNAGLPVLVDGAATYTMSADEFVLEVGQLVEAGADFVGGCCGTNPEFIARLAGAIGGGL